MNPKCGHLKDQVSDKSSLELQLQLGPDESKFGTLEENENNEVYCSISLILF